MSKQTNFHSDPASWVIRNRETLEVVAEVCSKKIVDAINVSKYEAIPIYDYLVSINRSIKNEQTNVG